MTKGTVQNKDKFLQTVAKSLGRERRTENVSRPQWTHRPQWDVFKGKTEDELVDILAKQCENIHTDMVKTTADQLQTALDDVINGYEANSVISWDDPRFEEYGVTKYFEEAKAKGKSIHTWDTAMGEENITIAEKANVGITFSDITLAESGTVVLLSNSGKGRSVSLLPTFYVAIIPKSTIVPRMTQATSYIHKLQQEQGKVPSCINFISGPSNSADIEMNLVVGVHGPIQATYIVVTDK
ncbi:LutC/YkgG family protein [Alkalihalobacterium bogoriense]|uniref:LutC/YkgG family protein n=1 Tax=Alkalihalobacterium bogoriense TaxID=246272 RepID=UPI00047A9E4E|nr:lactate utilization protein C [Alkalihalobacterium bogoriense]